MKKRKNGLSKGVKWKTSDIYFIKIFFEIPQLRRDQVDCGSLVPGGNKKI